MGVWDTSRRPRSTRSVARSPPSRPAAMVTPHRSRRTSPAFSSARRWSCWPGSFPKARSRIACPRSARPRTREPSGPQAMTPPLDDAVAAFDARHDALLPVLEGRRADLPLRYWRQAAHYTTPAADAVMARKAVEGGTAPVGRILERFGVAPADLAERLETPVGRVERLLDRPVRAPLVMLDGEDAQALRDDVTAAGLTEAATTIADADWAGDGPPSLRTFRPPGFGLGTTARDLAAVLGALSERGVAHRLDAVIYPKVEHPEEIDALYAFLDGVEAALGLPHRSIRVGFL